MYKLEERQKYVIRCKGGWPKNAAIGVSLQQPETTTLPSPFKRLYRAMKDWPLWEIFIRSKQGLSHKHVGSLHAADAAMAIENARDVYCRRNEGISIWVVESSHIHASTEDSEAFFDPANDKVYRHPTFYDLPDALKHM
jgi:ring-1,2-phenylacetyl-CoA epoxidase subunit PaaB